MPIPRVTILTGPIGSGKTTQLANWARGRVDVAGLLSPDAPEGRVFVDLTDGATMAMENPRADEDVVTVGRFRFSAAAFDWANERLLGAATGDKLVIVDEIGPLELAAGGLLPGTTAVLARSRGHAILVVRSHLVAAVVAALAIPDAVVTTDIASPGLTPLRRA